MSKDIYKYFIDLENSKCQKIGNFLLRNDTDFTDEKDPIWKNSTARILNTPFHLKQTDENNEILQPIASSQLYKHCGLITPPIFITNNYDDFYQTTQNVNTIPLKTVIASKITTSKNYKIHKCMAKPGFPSSLVEKWRFINSYKHLLLEFMTPKCFDEFVSMFLVDELRTEQDCHDDNYFLYKSPDSDKYEGFIRIDLDNVYITNKVDIFTLEDFKEFLEVKYHTYDPFLRKDWMSYEDRHKELRELLEEDILSNNNIVALHNALEFDLPKSIKKIGKKYGLTEVEINEIYNPIAMLWEYNRNNLGRDLEI